MADTMTFDLVSPERRLVSGEAKSVLIPGADGDMTAMPDHAPVITTLRPGVLTVEMTDGTQEYAVTGGFAEITAAGASVLAENAYVRSADNRAAIEEHLETARAAVEGTEGTERDVAEKVAADMAELLDNMT